MNRMALALLALLTAGSMLGAETLASGDAAHGLITALDRLGLEAVAAVDPTEPATFVAALKIQGGRLLVVQARHPSVDGLLQRLAARQYRDVYLDLQGTPTQKGKFFVQDAGANGILTTLPGSVEVDVLYEDGQRQTLFNGDLVAQHVTAAEYEARLAAADVRYARLLTVLTSALRETTEQSALQ
jgi:hypothetical protein